MVCGMAVLCVEGVNVEPLSRVEPVVCGMAVLCVEGVNVEF